MIVKFRPK